MKLKQNLNKTVSKLFRNSFVSAKTKRSGRETFLAVLATVAISCLRAMPSLWTGR